MPLPRYVTPQLQDNNMYEYKIKLDRVVDGDTIDADIDLGFDIKVKKRV